MSRENDTKAQTLRALRFKVLLSEIQKGKSVIFSSVSSGITGPAKLKKWEAISAVNSVSPVVRDVTEIKKKLFDIKMALKKKKKLSRWPGAL